MKKKIFTVLMIAVGIFLGIAGESQNVAARKNRHKVENITLGTIENTMITAPYDYVNFDSFEFLRLLNDERMKAGLNPVQMDIDLLCDAQQRAAETGLVLWDHARPAGQNATPLKKGGAENIGRFSPDGKSAFEGWKASSGHYANMMDPDIEVIGVAHYDTYWVWLGSYKGMDESKIVTEQDVPALERREITIELGDYPKNFCVMRKDMEDDYYASIYGNPSVGVPYYWAMMLDDNVDDVLAVNKTVQFYASEEEHCTKVSCDGKIIKVDTKYGSPSMYTWASSNPNVAKVDAGGLVTTLSEGTAVISCTPKYGGTAATYRLTVGNTSTGGKMDVSVPKVKKNIKVKVQEVSYKVTNTKKRTVTLVKAPKTKKVVIPASITINGKAYKVTTIGKKAFAGNTRLTKVTIGKNVKKIETKAF